MSEEDLRLLQQLSEFKGDLNDDDDDDDNMGMHGADEDGDDGENQVYSKSMSYDSLDKNDHHLPSNYHLHQQQHQQQHLSHHQPQHQHLQHHLLQQQQGHLLHHGSHHGHHLLPQDTQYLHHESSNDSYSNLQQFSFNAQGLLNNSNTNNSTNNNTNNNSTGWSPLQYLNSNSSSRMDPPTDQQTQQMLGYSSSGFTLPPSSAALAATPVTTLPSAGTAFFPSNAGNQSLSAGLASHFHHSQSFPGSTPHLLSQNSIPSTGNNHHDLDLDANAAYLIASLNQSPHQHHLHHHNAAFHELSDIHQELLAEIAAETNESNDGEHHQSQQQQKSDTSSHHSRKRSKSSEGLVRVTNIDGDEEDDDNDDADEKNIDSDADDDHLHHHHEGDGNHRRQHGDGIENDNKGRDGEGDEDEDDMHGDPILALASHYSKIPPSPTQLPSHNNHRS